MCGMGEAHHQGGLPGGEASDHLLLFVEIHTRDVGEDYFQTKHTPGKKKKNIGRWQLIR